MTGPEYIHKLCRELGVSDITLADMEYIMRAGAVVERIADRDYIPVALWLLGKADISPGNVESYADRAHN